MTDAQRRRDAALRRMRYVNRGVILGSIAGAAAVMELAHEATPTAFAKHAPVTVAVQPTAGHTSTAGTRGASTVAPTGRSSHGITAHRHTLSVEKAPTAAVQPGGSAASAPVATTPAATVAAPTVAPSAPVAVAPAPVAPAPAPVTSGAS